MSQISDPSMHVSEQKLPWLIELETCPSTNTWAIAHLPQLHHGDVVWTRHQTAGRGQHSRLWHSPKGVLTASVVLTQVPVERLAGASLVAGLAVIYAIQALLPALTGILYLKWPNDVVVEGRKLAGLLCEAKTKGDWAQVVVGIGLNHCIDLEQANLEPRLIQRAISLHHLSPRVPSEHALLERLRHSLLEAFGLLQVGNPQSLANLQSALCAHDALKGQHITLDQGGHEISGEILGIGDRGCLLLRLTQGEVRAFTSGHIVQTEKRTP